MAKPILPDVPISVTAGEFRELTQTAHALKAIAASMTTLLSGALERADKEFQDSMDIIKGLPPENEGGK
jgi:hypothetical protein